MGRGVPEGDWWYPYHSVRVRWTSKLPRVWHNALEIYFGQSEFSNNHLKKTQKGLINSGVTMPNFSNVDQELTHEINEAPKEEPETTRSRLLA